MSSIYTSNTAFHLFWSLCMIVMMLLLGSVKAQRDNMRPRFECDPCIDRSRYKIKAILHGSKGEDDQFWLKVQAAMRQAASDMSVGLEISLMASQGSQALVNMAREIRETSISKDFDALIVTMPNPTVRTAVEAAIAEEHMPVFGMNLGYSEAQEVGILGFAAQDEYLAGNLAAEEFFRWNPNMTTAAFVQSDASLIPRVQGFQNRWLREETRNGEERRMDYFLVDIQDPFNHVTALQELFLEDCLYDAIIVDNVESINIAIQAWQSSNCQAQCVLGAFDASPLTIYNIARENLAFGVSQQAHLQAALPVYLAALYVTTGKTLRLPMEEQVYLSGPNIITKENLPSDSQLNCEMDAFPICPNDFGIDGNTAAICGCIDRSRIRIGGVLHGVTTDSFWDPVFAAARQAAEDMGVQLDLIRFRPQANEEDVFTQMAARIRSLCEGGIDGIFLSIPEGGLVEAIERCLELRIPVVSVNAGAEISLEMGLLHHIGMVEYSAGYAAATQLMEAGMKEAYCLDHAAGNIVTFQRCQGFEAAIADAGDGVNYHGRIEVPLDNTAVYERIVEAALGADGNWEGKGLLLLGSPQVDMYRRSLSSRHPAAIVGSFDISAELLNGIDDGIFAFGIDQQPSMQGTMPIILLALQIYTQQSLKNHFIETGPTFITQSPSKEEQICVANFFNVCPKRPAEEMNFLSEGFFVFGWCLFGFLLLLMLWAFAWTVYYRDKWVVKISQPLFLHIILAGIFLSLMSLPFLSVETEYRFLQDSTSALLTQQPNPNVGRVDAACMLVPWFYGLGFAVTFSAIFAKIQRVKMIYVAGQRMQRKEITIRDVMHTMLVTLAIEFGILLSWQVTSPNRWERTVTQFERDFPVESVGKCDSESGYFFFLAMIIFHVLCLVYSLFLSWQTRNINNEFAESSYLFLAVMFMFQIQSLSVPILALVRESPDVFFFVQAIAIFFQNFTVLALIFGPKMYKTFTGQADPMGTGAAAGRADPRTILMRVRNNSALPNPSRQFRDLTQSGRTSDVHLSRGFSVASAPQAHPSDLTASVKSAIPFPLEKGANNGSSSTMADEGHSEAGLHNGLSRSNSFAASHCSNVSGKALAVAHEEVAVSQDFTESAEEPPAGVNAVPSNDDDTWEINPSLTEQESSYLRCQPVAYFRQPDSDSKQAHFWPSKVSESSPHETFQNSEVAR